MHNAYQHPTIPKVVAERTDQLLRTSLKPSSGGHLQLLQLGTRQSHALLQLLLLQLA